MNIGKSISLVGIAAVVTAIVAAVDATAIYYFHLNVLTTLVVTIFFVSLYFVFAVSDAERRSGSNFAARKVKEAESELHGLLWYEMDGDARMKWFEKVGTNAIPNELKFKYERIQERVRYWEKEQNRLS